MSFRSLSPQVMFEKMALEHVPQFRFKAKNVQDFRRWKKAAYPRVMATLGDFPKRVPADPMLLLEYEHDGLLKQRWLINVGPHIAAEFLINYPKGLKRGQKRPAILCCHGHGNYGKEPVMGNDSSAELRSAIARLRKAGKPVFAELTGAEKPDYLVAAACDEIVLAPSGSLMIPGVRVGIGVHTGKGCGATFQRSHPDNTMPRMINSRIFLIGSLPRG